MECLVLPGPWGFVPGTSEGTGISGRDALYSMQVDPNSADTRIHVLDANGLKLCTLFCHAVVLRAFSSVLAMAVEKAKTSGYGMDVEVVTGHAVRAIPAERRFRTVGSQVQKGEAHNEEDGDTEERRNIQWNLLIRAQPQLFAQALAWMYGAPLEISGQQMIQWATKGCSLLQLAREFQMLVLEKALRSLMSEAINRGGPEIAWALLVVCTNQNLLREQQCCCSHIARLGGYLAKPELLRVVPIDALSALLTCKDWIVDSEEEICAVLNSWITAKFQIGVQQGKDTHSHSQHCTDKLQQDSFATPPRRGAERMQQEHSEDKFLLPVSSPKVSNGGQSPRPRSPSKNAILLLPQTVDTSTGQSGSDAGLSPADEAALSKASASWDIRWADLPLSMLRKLSEIKVLPESLVSDITQWLTKRKQCSDNISKISEAQKFAINAERIVERKRKVIENLTSDQEKRSREAKAQIEAMAAELNTKSTRPAVRKSVASVTLQPPESPKPQKPLKESPKKIVTELSLKGGGTNMMKLVIAREQLFKAEKTAEDATSYLRAIKGMPVKVRLSRPTVMWRRGIVEQSMESDDMSFSPCHSMSLSPAASRTRVRFRTNTWNPSKSLSQEIGIVSMCTDVASSPKSFNSATGSMSKDKLNSEGQTEASDSKRPLDPMKFCEEFLSRSARPSKPLARPAVKNKREMASHVQDLPGDWATVDCPWLTRRRCHHVSFRRPHGWENHFTSLEVRRDRLVGAIKTSDLADNDSRRPRSSNVLQRKCLLIGLRQVTKGRHEILVRLARRRFSADEDLETDDGTSFRASQNLTVPSPSHSMPKESHVAAGQSGIGDEVAPEVGSMRGIRFGIGLYEAGNSDENIKPELIERMARKMKKRDGEAKDKKASTSKQHPGWKRLRDTLLRCALNGRLANFLRIRKEQLGNSGKFTPALRFPSAKLWLPQEKLDRVLDQSTDDSFPVAADQGLLEASSEMPPPHVDNDVKWSKNKHVASQGETANGDPSPHDESGASAKSGRDTEANDSIASDSLRFNDRDAMDLVILLVLDLDSHTLRFAVEQVPCGSIGEMSIDSDVTSAFHCRHRFLGRWRDDEELTKDLFDGLTDIPKGSRYTFLIEVDAPKVAASVGWNGRAELEVLPPAALSRSWWIDLLDRSVHDQPFCWPRERGLPKWRRRHLPQANSFQDSWREDASCIEKDEQPVTESPAQKRYTLDPQRMSTAFLKVLPKETPNPGDDDMIPARAAESETETSSSKL